jgi:4-oxalocrotonate tautomerase
MPHINFKLYPGKEDGFKKDLAEALRKTLAEKSGVWSEDDISVSIEEIPKENFEEQTKASFKPEELAIESKWIKK